MLREEMAGQALISVTADREELANAMKEGRPPEFRGD
jgi:hypothetical protein